MSKGQITGQVFIYIMAAIIIGILILLGYQAIQTVVVNSCNTEKLVFMNNIFAHIDTAKSYEKYDPAVPCGYEQVCFINTSLIGQANNNCDIGVLKHSAISSDEKNVFVRNSKTIVPAGYSPKVAVTDPEGCVCIESKNNRFHLLLEDMGPVTRISEQS